ncbi:MAG: aspartate aminotransferase family protein [Actinobacteria bacterium]|nr:MAG: aspartate aminotransferase family protein [Actinomycetota bacterium]
MALTTQVTERDLHRLDRLIAEQETIFLSRQRRSAELASRANRSLAGGVTSSWQISRPQPIWISHGKGSRVFDADGNEYVDLHGGYGVMAAGHAHPKVVEAVSARAAKGTHFAQPTEDAIVVAENLAGRFGLPLWRFANSGTEATMDAVHLMRAATGRWKVVKVEGTYHGHHDSVQVSVYEPLEELGPPDHPWSAPASTGIPPEIVRLTIVVPFNDLPALERVFAEHDGEIAGLIVEPVMMNAGIIPPDPGYLEGTREITRRHGALLAYDEVKTGLTVGPGGATGLYGVTPDIVCLAKAMGGGLSGAAIGGTAEVMDCIVRRDYDQVGTFNGNPLLMAAARVVLTEILTDEAYQHIDALRDQMAAGIERVIGETGLPAHVVAMGAKGCVTFSPTPVRNYREFLAIDDRFSHCHWLYQMAGGVLLPPWGKTEQWMLSVQHRPEDVERFLGNFERFAGALRS